MEERGLKDLSLERGGRKPRERDRAKSTAARQSTEHQGSVLSDRSKAGRDPRTAGWEMGALQ